MGGRSAEHKDLADTSSIDWKKGSTVVLSSLSVLPDGQRRWQSEDTLGVIRLFADHLGQIC